MTQRPLRGTNNQPGSLLNEKLGSNLSGNKHVKIRELNDAFRKSMPRDVYLTAGVTALSAESQTEAIWRVKTFDAFTEDVESRWRAVSRFRGRFHHPALRTGRASFPASGSPCAASPLRVVNECTWWLGSRARKRVKRAKLARPGPLCSIRSVSCRLDFGNGACPHP